MSASSDTERKGHKRKLADTLGPSALQREDLSAESVGCQAQRLTYALEEALRQGPDQADRAGLRRAAHSLAELSKNEELVDLVVECGAIGATVPLLSFFHRQEEDCSMEQPTSRCSGEEVEKEACFVLGLLAIKQEHQHRIADAGALPGLVNLLRQYAPLSPPPSVAASVIRRAADAITNLAHENGIIKSRVRSEGGIPPLVTLLESLDTKVARAAAGALRTLAFKNEENKNQIVECGALPTLIQMLRSDDVGLHYEAVGVIGNLVHSSQHIKRRVLDDGALQPVIGLLSSKCHESQREAALLLGQFATAEPDYKAKIVQRGAVPPLIVMLRAPDAALKEMAAFALGRLAQNQDNQAGIVQNGGLDPLIDLVESHAESLQHNAAFALYGLADNPDNIAGIIKAGGAQRLQNAELIAQASKDCVQKTVKRLEDKLQGKVLKQALYCMHSTDKMMQERTVTALARLAQAGDLQNIFIKRQGLDILMSLVTNHVADPDSQREAAGALLELVKKSRAIAPVDCVPVPQRPQVYLGEQYVNNPMLSDVTFLVEGRQFHAHRIALLASSDTFRAMFDGNYIEKDASSIPIPNIRYAVFHAMMLCIYTGVCEVEPEMAVEVLQAADQYMLEGLKRLCEQAIGNSLTTTSLEGMWELSEQFNAPALGQQCVVFALQNYEIITAEKGSAMSPCQGVAAFASMLDRMSNALKDHITDQLAKHAAQDTTS